ncbi:DegT/DnrJ/EryC1/StrS family aminotransferase [bacterium]|nr:DegT/DnrJ/EryC1/StrS family aminotransferase [bacterium]
MEVKFLDLKKQYSLLKNEIDSAVQTVFADAAFIKGKEVEKFEESFANYCGVSHCISCGNGTDALTVLLKVHNLPKGSEVILPANTFIATAEAAVSNGLKPVFADIKEDFTISPESAESLINPNTSAIIAVHLYGHPADMEPLKKIAEKHDLKLFEDAAQAHGALYRGKKVGTLADGAGFSFYPGKVLGAAGDAGAVLLNDEEKALKAKMFCNHGRSLKYFHEFAGINSRMDTLQAAVLNVKLKHLDEWVEARNRVAKMYIEQLSGVSEIVLPEIHPETLDAWHLFVIKTEKRDHLQEYLKNCGIETGIHYPLSLPEQPAFASHMSYCGGYRALKESHTLLSLPIGEHLNAEEVVFVSEKIKEFFVKNI